MRMPSHRPRSTPPKGPIGSAAVRFSAGVFAAWLLVVGLSLVGFFLAACSDSPDPHTAQLKETAPRDLDEARRLWAQNGSPDYRLTITQECFCRDALGPLQVQVRDGLVVEVIGPDGTLRDVSQGFTVPFLFDRAQAWLARPEEDARVEFHPELGYPIVAGYRGHPEVDDFWTIHVRAYEALAAGPAMPTDCPPTGARRYDLYVLDRSGTLIVRGILGLDFLDPPTGSEATQLIRGVRCLSAAANAESGWTSRTGQWDVVGEVVGRNLWLDLDAGILDDNIVLTGHFDLGAGPDASGEWSHATIAGPREQGTFRAVQRAR